MKDRRPPFDPFDPLFDRPAPDCDDQLPLISRVGRGLQGDGYMVKVKQDSDCETYLEGMVYDSATKTYKSDWTSENINGGKLLYQYNLRPYTNPQTFTITFRLQRPDRPEWEWTTPAIPYIWDADNDGTADVDDIVGAGVADLFLKKTTEAEWHYPTITATQYANGEMTDKTHDKLVYPDSWTREMFNAPNPGDPWSVNLQYGVGGDIDAPNVDDIAKLIGITVENIRNIIKNSPVPTETIPDDNLKKYIDRRDLEDLEHIHGDLGFDDKLLNDGNTLTYTQKHGDKLTVKTPTVKAYIDARMDDMERGLHDGLQNLVNKVVGGGTVNADGSITWPSDSPLSDPNARIAAGNLNLYGDDDRSKWIKTHKSELEDDVWAR